MSRCLDCVNYDHKNHNCPHFCDVIKFLVKDVREDAIDELVREAKEQYTMVEITYYDGTTDTVRYIALALLEQIAGNLKGNKNE